MPSKKSKEKSSRILRLLKFNYLCYDGFHNKIAIIYYIYKIRYFLHNDIAI